MWYKRRIVFKKQTVTGNKVPAGTFLPDNSPVIFEEFGLAVLLGVAMLVVFSFPFSFVTLELLSQWSFWLF